MMTPTQIVHRAAGSPLPHDTAGEPISPAFGDKGQPCAKCGHPNGIYSRDQLVSSNFLPTKNANRLSSFGGARYCAACVFCARTLRLRCISWFASATGFRHWVTRPQVPKAPRPDGLSALLDPPEPPFVVGLPLYGIAHGGEAHWRRTWWPSEPRHTEPLIRLQSKHVAIYARPAYSRDRYSVQVDDALEFVLDRDIWLRTRDAAIELMARAVADGVHVYAAWKSLKALTLPGRSSPALAAAWPRLTAALRPHVAAVWWPTFCQLIEQPREPESE